MFRVVLALLLCVALPVMAQSQPAATASAGEHYVFMENLAVGVLGWLACLVGVWSGYAMMRKPFRGGSET